MRILGINSDTWLTSAALIEDGKIIAAAPEERFNRQKAYRYFPRKAIEFCLKTAGCKIEDVDYIAVGWNPGKHIKSYNPRFSLSLRWRGDYLSSIPNSLMMLYEDKNIESTEHHLMFDKHTAKIVYVEHHLTHAANGFYLSPFKEAAIMTADGRGEDDTAAYYIAKGDSIKKIGQTLFPHSLGSFYSTFTQFLGFDVHTDEWKVMALASYADKNNPYYEKVKSLIHVLSDGSIEMDMSYFNYHIHDQLYFFTDKFVLAFGEQRKKTDPIEKRHYQIASALQAVTEEILIQCLGYLYSKTHLPNLVVNGGVFMNSVFNGKILSNTPFKKVFVSSCPDDSGTSIGAALHVYMQKSKEKHRFEQLHNYYGPEFSNEEIKKTIESCKLKAEYHEDIEKKSAEEVSKGKLIGWFQGKMEFGQRALGNRSILCDPRDASMKDKVNLAVKYRESFRPFAPAVLEEKRLEYFDLEKDTYVPFMEKVYPVKKEKRSIIPAVTHVDGSGRLQTVNKAMQARFHKLISEFEKITGVPVILNTSFNLNGEPIVCTPLEAIRTFNSCGLDILVMGNYLIRK